MRANQIKWTVVSLLATVLVTLERAVASEGEGGPSLFTGDLGNIIWSLLTFVVVLWVLGKFAWGPILGALQKREDFIRDSLEQAKHDRERARAEREEFAEKLAAAKTEAAGIIDEGRRNAESLKRKIEEDAKAEANAIIERAKREIGLATDSAIKELYDTSGKLAVDIASRIIRKEISAKDHERLISDSLEEMSKGNGN